MRAMQKLVRNGNSTQLTLPKPILTHLGWLPGEWVIVELQEDGSLNVHMPTEKDFVRKQRGAVVMRQPALVQP